MKNAINYYYNIDVEDIHQKNKNYKFKYDGHEYILVLYEDDISRINQIYNLHVQLLNSGLYCHQIILNINDEPVILLEGKYYVLLKINISNRRIQIEDIINFSKNYLVYRNNTEIKNWLELWATKTDYIEYQISQFGIKYPIISQSASYYIGLAENAISYLKNQSLNSEIFTISHRRLKYSSTLIDLYNPLNFIIDLPVRDICEYLKNIYFERNIDIFQYIIRLNLSRENSILLFSRMLYPTYYFDAIEDCIDDKSDEKNILKYIQKVDDFEKILSEIMLYYKKIYNIEVIEWLIKT